MGFAQRAYESLGGQILASGVRALQANLGYCCTLRCSHCHIEASPERTEAMDSPTAGALISALEQNPSIDTLDLTGGAPELHPRLRWLISSARWLGRHVIVRSNLSVLGEPGMEGLPGFFASEGVEIAASFPHYERASFERMRGRGSFDASVRTLRTLNALGYGSNALVLSLVHNPLGAFFAPCEAELEAIYQRELGQLGLRFTRLHALVNMPIGRFGQYLERTGQRNAYQRQLEACFNPCALEGVMCRTLVSVGPDGRLYDCDFNQALGAGVIEGMPERITGFDAVVLGSRRIAVGEHCFGCVAGQGFT